MGLKTNFSFEVQYPADSDRTESERQQLMDSLQDTLQQCLAGQDAEAEVVVSDSHRGSRNKIVELTTCLEDTQLAGIMESFSETHGVGVTALD